MCFSTVFANAGEDGTLKSNLERLNASYFLDIQQLLMLLVVSLKTEGGSAR